MPNAFATLLTSTNYLPGALVLAQSLRDTGTSHDIILLATETVISATQSEIVGLFDKIIQVNVLTLQGNLSILKYVYKYVSILNFFSEQFRYTDSSFCYADSSISG